MLVLFETPAGYAIFKLLDEKKLHKTENLYKEFESAENASKILKIKHFEKFEDMTEALAAATAAIEGKISKKLKKLLKKVVVKEAHEQLAVADAKLGNVIKDKLNISCVSNTAIGELMRCIRSQADSLIGSLPQKEMVAMALGLAHSLSRYKLKFSPDKVDTMIVQAVSLLDDLDKELNNYIMRCREWYGWHFPELGKIITDNLVYVKTVKTLGTREEAANCSFSEILPDDVEEKVKEAAEISMGTEISEEDINNIHYLCDQVIEMTSYRTQLYEYLKNRMTAIAPNLTVLVGELVGARLIAHAGSLLNLAKHPASTVQILGAEKALFRAFKTKHDTPKYGLLYHAQLIGQTAPKLKGKVARMLASKAALACRIDALGDETTQEHGIETKAKLLTRMKALEESGMRRISGMARSKAKMEKYESKSEIKQYPVAQDITQVGTSQKRKHAADEEETPQPKKKKKKIKQETPGGESSMVEVEIGEVELDEEETPQPKKKKKKIKQETPGGESSMVEVEIGEVELDETMPTSSEKKKKKKKIKKEKDE